MNYIENFKEDDLKYICGKIPHSDVKKFFQKHINEFHKIKPGFRAKTLEKNDVFEILYDHHENLFISNFLNGFISKNLDQINRFFNVQMNNGDDEDVALIKSLSKSVFSDNISLYFRVSGKEASEDYLRLICASVKHSSEISKINFKLYNELELSNKDMKDLKSKIEAYDSKIDRLNRKLDFFKNVDKENNKNIKTIKKLEDINENFSLQISEYINEEKLFNEKIMNLRDELNNNKRNIKKLMPKEEHLKEIEKIKFDYELILSENISKLESLEMEKTNLENELTFLKEKFNIDNFIDESVTYPYKPKDIGEFEEFFEYNLESIGLNIHDKSYDLFLRYITSIIFSGVPILVKYNVGKNLAKILSNTLNGSKVYRSINIDSSAKLHEINNFLKSIDDRVILINNIIGSGRELEILPLLLSHRDKIIIITYLYDRTLYYLPKESLEYINYINLNNYEVLSKNVKLDEDGSFIDQEEYIPEDFITKINKKQNKILNNIIEELGIEKNLNPFMNSSIVDSDFLNCILLFSLLPYARDVLKVNPYEYSLELQQYAGKSSNNYYKDIFLEWFRI